MKFLLENVVYVLVKFFFIVVLLKFGSCLLFFKILFSLFSKGEVKLCGSFRFEVLLELYF